MSIGTWQIIIILSIIAFIIYRNIKNRPEQKLDDRTQGFLKDLGNEAKSKSKQKNKSKVRIRKNDDLGAKLKKLKRMYNNGHLSKVEFEKAKNKLLK